MQIISDDVAETTPPSSPEIIYLSQSLSLPNIPANRGFLELTKKLQAADKAKRYHQWLLATTGLPIIERTNALTRWRNYQEFQHKIAEPLTKK
jgi:hypothetical protein